MSKHWQRDMEQLQKRLSRQAGLVEAAIGKAVRALRERDSSAASDVVRGDAAIDQQEVAIENECLKMLALHQPVATELRRVVAAMRVNVELERMADLAGQVAEAARTVGGRPPLPAAATRLADLATAMVRQALDAHVLLDQGLAREVVRLDDEADRLLRDCLGALEADLRRAPDLLGPGLALAEALRHLERIADHATNIAEDVIYLVEGEIVRHRMHA
jgi:phosphate transport system protein